MKLAISVLVVVHLIAILWHGDAHSLLGIELPTLKNVFIYVVILAAPIVSAILVWARYMILGTGLFAFSMVGALVFGVYHHYILVSSDNIAHLPMGLPELHVQFIGSAALIAIIEITAALSGFFALGIAYGSLVTKYR